MEARKEGRPGLWFRLYRTRAVRFVPKLLLLLVAAGIARAAGPNIPIIATYAGTGSSNSDDPLGDGGQATRALLRLPGDLEVDGAGNLYIVAGNRVRKVTPAGIISTVAGNGTTTYAGDGVLATQTGMNVSGIAVDQAGNLYISDSDAHRVRKVSSNGIIATVAGSGTFPGFAGDGGPATQASLGRPGALTIDRSGNLLISDWDNRRIRKINAAGIISTLVGNGASESSGDGGPAAAAGLATAGAAVMDPAGNLYLIDGNRIRKVDAAGTITAYAGGGPFQYDPVASHIALDAPVALALDAAGNLFVAEAHFAVRMISPQRITRLVAGSLDGSLGYSGDGGPADQARLRFPAGVAVDAQGNQYISDSLNHRVRKVTPQPAVIVPVGLDAFAAYESIAMAGWPADIVVGDVNGDNRNDVITTTSANPQQADPANDFKLRVHIQRADGTLAPAIAFNYPAGNANAGGKLALADFNRDGVLDVVVGHNSGVTIMEGSGTSNFVLHSFYGDTATPAVEAMTVGDMDRDGNQDVVSAHTELVNSTVYPRVTVAYGNGQGGTSRLSSVPITYASTRDIEVADVNGDGWLDVVDANFWHMDLLLNDAHGELLSGQIIANEMTDGLSVGDINGDGRADAVASVLYDSQMVILPQRPQGFLAPPVRKRSYPLAGDTVVADMDGDRRADVVVAHGVGAISLFLQTDSGLQEGIKYRLPLNGVAASDGPMATGDVNGDGCRDIVLSPHGLGLVTLKGQHCWIAGGYSNPLIPPRPDSALKPQLPGAVAQAVVATPPTRAPASRERRLRDLLVRINLLPRVLAWLAERYVAMSPEPMPPAAAALPRSSSVVAGRSQPVRPVAMAARNVSVSRAVPRSHMHGTVCAR